MTVDIFPFFPVNIDGGPDFLVLYAVVVVVGLALLMKYRAVTLAAIDRRAPSDAVPNPLARGRLPTGEEVYAVAWLRGGRPAVRDTLVAAAVADGWFRKHDEGVEVVRPRSHGDAACLDAFAEMCRTLPDSALSPSSQSSSTLPNVTTAPALRDLATTAARNAEPRLQELLLAAGFWREPHVAESVQRRLRWIGSILVVFGLLRVARGILLGNPVLYLVLEILVAAFAVALVGLVPRNTGPGLDYLDWLTSVTHSLAKDIRSGRSAAHGEVALGVAAVGAGLLASAPLFVVFYANLWPTPVHASTPGSSCSSSSCSSSSSSCSSGCGSGCGGGGGCGG